MKLYDCTVRPGGWVNHGVPKVDLTIAEIALLRSLHGYGGVLDIKEAASGMEITIKSQALRNKLAGTYGRKAVARAFGRFGPLPEKFDDLPGEEDVGPDEESEAGETPDDDHEDEFNSFSGGRAA